MRYTVNTGHGMTPEAIHQGERATRGEAQRLAVELIRSGRAVSVEVRRDYALLDCYVKRGESPRHIYSAKQREGKSRIEDRDETDYPDELVDEGAVYDARYDDERARLSQGGAW